MEELIDLIDIAFANYNATRTAGAGHQSRLDVMRQAVDPERPSIQPPLSFPETLCTPRLGIAVETAKARGPSKPGNVRRAYVQIDKATYTNDALCCRHDLVGEPLTVHIDEDDMRTIEAFLPDGTSLGVLKVREKGWKADQDDFASHGRRVASRPLSRSDWAWVEAQLADPEDCTSLDERLALELQFFGGFKLREMQDLLVEHCIPPTPELPTWRIHLPCPRLGRTWVFALPPLARTLDHWFGGRSALPHGAQLESGEPIFDSLNSAVRGVRRLLKRASARAAAHGSLASARSLERGSSVSLRSTFEHISGGGFAFLAGLSANAALRSMAIAEYARRIQLTSEALEAAWSKLAPFWAGYPTSPDYEGDGDKVRAPASEARPSRNFKESPRVVLHEHAGIWTARLVDMPIQVVARSKRICFALLREAARKVARTCPAHWHPSAPVEPAQVLQVMTLLERSRLSYAQDQVRRHRFWEAGPRLRESLHAVKQIEAEVRANAVPPPTLENE